MRLISAVAMENVEAALHMGFRSSVTADAGLGVNSRPRGGEMLAVRVNQLALPEPFVEEGVEKVREVSLGICHILS